MPSTKSLATHQKARLPAALASLNNSHRSDLRTCCVGARSSSKPNLVPARPLHLRSVAWRSSFVLNLSSTMSGCALAIEVEARAIAGCYRVVAMTLVPNLIWPCNSSMLSHCTNSFLVSPSLALKFVRRKLNLRSFYLGTSAKVSIG